LHINITRVPDQVDLKITCLAPDAVYLRERQQFDVDVPADLDQFR